MSHESEYALEEDVCAVLITAYYVNQIKRAKR